MSKEVVYLSGLNGLRAIAAFSVVISHVNLLPGIADFGIPSIFLFSTTLAAYAVTLFFVISGFLITYLLVKELESFQRVAISKFYMRRILRIWPIYYLFIIIALIVYLILGKHDVFQNPLIWFYILFSANFPFFLKLGGINILFHYWSIGVEEQFYLFWPWIVRLKSINLFKTTALLFIIFTMIKVVLWYFFRAESVWYKIFYVNRFNCMMIGAMGAILYFKNNRQFIGFFSNKIVQFIAWTFFILVSIDFIHIPLPIAHEIISVAALCMIIGQVNVKNRLINLENGFFDFIGKISYGIYVIHPLVIMLLSIFFKDIDIEQNTKIVLVFISVLLSTILLAFISYNYYEKPFLKFKTIFAVIKSSNSMLQG